LAGMSELERDEEENEIHEPFYRKRALRVKYMNLQ